MRHYLNVKEKINLFLDTALIGRVVNVFLVYDVIDCLSYCSADVRCLSFNFGTSSENSSMLQCELMDTDETSRYPLIHRQGTLFYSMDTVSYTENNTWAGRNDQIYFECLTWRLQKILI